MNDDSLLFITVRQLAVHHCTTACCSSLYDSLLFITVRQLAVHHCAATTLIREILCIGLFFFTHACAAFFLHSQLSALFWVLACSPLTLQQARRTPSKHTHTRTHPLQYTERCTHTRILAEHTHKRTHPLQYTERYTHTHPLWTHTHASSSNTHASSSNTHTRILFEHTHTHPLRTHTRILFKHTQPKKDNSCIRKCTWLTFFGAQQSSSELARTTINGICAVVLAGKCPN
jgi:hypothetical protein